TRSARITLPGPKADLRLTPKPPAVETRIFKDRAEGAVRSVHPRSAAVFAHVDLELLLGALHLPLAVGAAHIGQGDPRQPAFQVDVPEGHTAQMGDGADAA